MSAKELAESIESLIVSANDRYASRITKVQEDLYAAIVLKLKDIEIDADGYILQTANNRKIISEAETLIDEALSGKYQSAVEEQLSIIPEIDNLNVEYFSAAADTFKENRNFIKSLQQQTIQNLETNLLQDGLQFQVKQPLADIMNQNINGGGSFSGFLDQLRAFIKGDQTLDGRLMSYSRGILRDALFQYSRSYQQAITSDLGLMWFRYDGGVIDKTREFCRERAGGYYHQSEIEAWADEDWQGRNRFTTKSSIFIYCGGYNCGHSLIPVHDSIVPKEDLERIK